MVFFFLKFFFFIKKKKKKNPITHKRILRQSRMTWMLYGHRVRRRPLSWGGIWPAPQCPQVAARGHSALGPSVLRARVAGVSVCIRRHVCVRVCACACMHVCAHVSVCACACMHICARVSECTCVCTCVCVSELERTSGQILWWVTWKHGSLKTHSFSFSEPETENR